MGLRIRNISVVQKQAKIIFVMDINGALRIKKCLAKKPVLYF